MILLVSIRKLRRKFTPQTPKISIRKTQHHSTTSINQIPHRTKKHMADYGAKLENYEWIQTENEVTIELDLPGNQKNTNSS